MKKQVTSFEIIKHGFNALCGFDPSIFNDLMERLSKLQDHPNDRQNQMILVYGEGKGKTMLFNTFLKKVFWDSIFIEDEFTLEKMEDCKKTAFSEIFLYEGNYYENLIKLSILISNDDNVLFCLENQADDNNTNIDFLHSIKIKPYLKNDELTAIAQAIEDPRAINDFRDFLRNFYEPF